MEYYKIDITQTGKPRGKTKEDYAIFNRDSKKFPTKSEAVQYLKDTYGNCKRQAMFQDTNAGARQMGWVYHFNNADLSHFPVEKWHQLDWVTLSHITSDIITEVK